ncbi:Protein of unknown function [Microterricola viridarii]|uniref:DUF2975 domain-containing protein n=1 Tax=Microterricola viridarii TaxID=412690 RepID=A0A1H1RGS4_9MICO|nr:Protein of unknown function [Microterricola viridarii]
MQAVAVAGARAVLVVLLAVSVLAQVVLIPRLALDTVAVFPEAEPLRMPGIIGCVAIVLCAQVALLAAWRLLSLLRHGGMLQPAASGPLNALIGSGVAAVVLFLASFAILTAAQSMPPAAMIIMVLGVLGGSGLTVGALAMRERVRKAGAVQRDVVEAA